MPKTIKEYPLLPLFRKFVNEIKKGKHLQKNGKVIKKKSIDNYSNLEKLLFNFSTKKNFNIRIRNLTKLHRKHFEQEQKYWKKFYLEFTNYLYDDRHQFDNYVGRQMKLLRAFFNYINSEKGISIGMLYKYFHTPNEEIDIIIVSPERLNFLINSKELEGLLSEKLKFTRDIFIIGCSVGLRYCDLINLTPLNLEFSKHGVYVKVRSRKTDKITKIKLPPYAVEIINKYTGRWKRILPWFSNATLNVNIKHLAERAGWTEPAIKTRQRRGISIPFRKQKTYRFCDLVTTHTMRRTAITTMLSLGMNEQMVRQVSGHAPGSKEFYRYVSFAQANLDNEIDKMHRKLSRIK